jgi:hypothetical protein
MINICDHSIGCGLNILTTYLQDRLDFKIHYTSISGFITVIYSGDKIVGTWCDDDLEQSIVGAINNLTNSK